MKKKKNTYIKLKIILATAVARVRVCTQQQHRHNTFDKRNDTLRELRNCFGSISFPFLFTTCATPHIPTRMNCVRSFVVRSRNACIYFSIWTWWWWEYVYGIAYTHPTDEVGTQQARATASSQPEAQKRYTRVEFFALRVIAYIIYFGMCTAKRCECVCVRSSRSVARART